MTLFVLGLFGGLWGIGNSEVRRFERAAADEIRSQLQGPERRVSVRTRLAGVSGALASASIDARHFQTDGLPLFVEPDRSTRGVLHELRLDLRDFSLRGLRVERLRATIPDCRFDYSLAVRKQQIRLSRSGEGTGEVEIREQDLGAFIVRKFREIKRATVRVANDRVLVRGYGEFLIFRTEFEVDARLEAVDGTQLVLTDCRILFDGQPADALAAKTLLDLLNPVVDLNRDLALFDAIRIEALSLRDGAIRARGRTKIPVRPAAVPAAAETPSTRS